MTVKIHPERSFITPAGLAERWSIATKTLANYRTRGMGPDFIKIGGLVRYRLEAVEKYETDRSVQAVFA